MQNPGYGLFTHVVVTGVFLSCLVLVYPYLSVPLWALWLTGLVILSRLPISLKSYTQHLAYKRNPLYCEYFQSIRQSTPKLKSILANLGIRPIGTHMIIGTSQSGKTQLLENTEPNNTVVLGCQTYWHHGMLFIDTPGIETIEETRWLAPLFQALSVYQISHPLQSISITLDAMETHSPLLPAIVSKVCQFNHQFMSGKKMPCLQLMLTKCDKIPKFISTFAALPLEEKSNKFGLLFKHKNVLLNPEQAFSKRFGQLFDQLGDFLKDEAHPLLAHFDAMGPKLLETTKSISAEGSFLRSICFCSTRTNPPLFLDEWLSQQHVPRIQLNQLAFTHSLVVAAIIIGLFAVNTWEILETNKQQVGEIEQQLHRASLNHDPILAKLDQLAKAADLAKSLPSPKLKLNKLANLEDQVSQDYQKAIDNDFKFWIKQQLEGALVNLSSNTIKDFSVYMMLCDDRVRDDEALTEWFDSYWGQHLSPLERSSAEKHLKALQTHPSHCALNHELITKAQAYLSHIPLADLIITLTQDAWDKLEKDRPTTLPFKIESIYTYDNFHPVLDHGLAENYQTLRKYKQQEEDQPVLALSKSHYLDQYNKVWQQALNNIHMPKFANLAEADQVLLDLYQGQKRLSGMLEAILANTYHPEDKNFSKQIVSVLGHSPIPKDKLGQRLDNWLKQLHDYLVHLHIGQSKHLVFIQSKQRLLNAPKDGLSYLKQQARDFPPQVTAWLDTLIQQTWQGMLSETHAYLSSEWQRTIYKDYLNHVEERFPLFSKASVDIDRNAFAGFFGPSSPLQNFIADKLAPFIDKDKSGWSWKKCDGLALSQSSQSIDALMKADAIKAMFFTEDSAKAPLMHWQLTPKSMSESLSQMQIISPSKTVAFKTGQLEKQRVEIAIPMQEPSITLTFDDKHHLSTSQVYQGPWAWLRALRRATPEAPSDGDTKHFTLTFRFNDAEAIFDATTTVAVNPLTTGMLDGFRCPKDL